MNDHYVAQTYLNSFTNSKGFLIPYYKADHSILGSPKRPKSVCYETNGDSNCYLDDSRFLEKYLPLFENHWKKNVEFLRQKILDDVMKFQIAGYIAFLRSCTPTAKRLGQNTIKQVIKPTVDNLISRYFETNPPTDIDTRDKIAHMINNKQIDVVINREFPHALGISSLHESIAKLYHGSWLILLNGTSNQYITSDNPATAYYHD